MAHEVEQMAYRSRSAADLPWHGLGFAVTSDMTVDQMKEAAGLDWKIIMKASYYLDAKTQEFEKVDGVRMALRSSDRRYYGTFDEKWEPVQNGTVLDFFRRYCEAGDMTLETAGSLKHGAVVWALAKLHEGAFTLAGGDTVEGYVLLCNGHDGTMRYRGFPTSVRVVCMNTLRAAINGARKDGFALGHHKLTAQDVERAHAQLSNTIDSMRKFQEQAEYLSQISVDARGQEVRAYVAQLVHPELLQDVVTATEASNALATGSSLLDAVIAQKTYKSLEYADFNRAGRAILDAIVDSPGSELPSAQNTWWGAVNGVSYYTDHEFGRGADSRMRSAWFGQNAILKDKAVDLAMEYAEKTV